MASSHIGVWQLFLQPPPLCLISGCQSNMLEFGVVTSVAVRSIATVTNSRQSFTSIKYTSGIHDAILEDLSTNRPQAKKYVLQELRINTHM